MERLTGCVWTLLDWFERPKAHKQGLKAPTKLGRAPQQPSERARKKVATHPDILVNFNVDHFNDGSQGPAII